MKAMAHWLELKGHRPKSPSILFDEVFSEQVFATGKIEEGRILRDFFKRTGQAMMQPWMVEMVKSMMRNLPISMLTRLGLANFITPRTKGWSGARDAMNEYIAERETDNRKALKLDELVQMAETELN